MTFTERVGTTAARILDKWTSGAVKSTFTEAATAYDDDPKADEYRRLSGGKRDLLPIQFKRGQEMAFYLWQRNPLARRMIEILVDFCSGDDYAVRVKIKNRSADGEIQDTGKNEAQAIWDDFARDAVNNLEEETPQMTQDLLINGELAMPTTVNPVDGSVRLGYIDPGNITEVVLDPMNARQPKILKARGVGSSEEIPFRVCQVDLDPLSPTFNKMTGQILYFRINHVVNQTRGHSELLELVDWLDALDQFLFDSLDGFRLRNSFFYDLELQGLTQEKIEEEAAKITVPANGSIRVHNEKAKYAVQTPDLKAVEVERALVAFQTFVVGSKGFPAMWFGSGAETNKATAGEMSIPTMKMIRGVQGTIRSLVKKMARYVMDQAEIAGKLKLQEGEYIDVEVTMFDPEKKDTEQIGAGMTQLVQAMVVAVQQGWVGTDTAKKIMDGIVTRMGVEVDTDKTVQDLLDEKAQSDEANLANDTYGNLDPKKAFGGNGNPQNQNQDLNLQDQQRNSEEGQPIKILQTFQPAPVTVHVERKAKLTEAKFEVERDSKGRILGITRKAKEN
jgi:hypothetical protein